MFCNNHINNFTFNIYSNFWTAINTPLTSDLKDIISFLPPRIPWLGIDATVTQVMSQEKFESWSAALTGQLVCKWYCKN